MCFALLFVVLPSWRIKIYITALDMAQTTRTDARVCVWGSRGYCSPFRELNIPKIMIVDLCFFWFRARVLL